jgi:hypothetical protein
MVKKIAIVFVKAGLQYFCHKGRIGHGYNWLAGLQGFFKVFVENGDEGMKVKVGGKVVKAGVPHSVPFKGGGIPVQGGGMVKNDEATKKWADFKKGQNISYTQAQTIDMTYTI